MMGGWNQNNDDRVNSKLGHCREGTNIVSFVLDSAQFAAFDQDREISIKLVNTGGRFNLKQVFEFKSPEAHFYFYARSMREVAQDKWQPATHWSLDGVPRDDPSKRRPIELDEQTKTLSFAAIVEALPLFKEFDADTRTWISIRDVQYDLREV